MINLPGGYVMDADDCCYIIGKPYTSPKDGKVSLAKKTYYTDLKRACENVVERCARDAVASGEITDLCKLTDYIAQVKFDIETLIMGKTVIKPASALPAHVAEDET